MGNVNPPSSQSQTCPENKFVVGRQRMMEIFSKMVVEVQIHAKEIIFVIAIMLTALAALNNGTKSKKLDPPSRFFPASSLVIDYPYGSMALLRNRIMDQEVSFVMFYAPWDAQSIHAKSDFEAAARFYHNQIFFVAINCWWNDGECREVNNFKSFPIFVAHLAHLSFSIEYKAPISAENMIVFLNHVLRPYKPIHNKNDLLNLQTKHQSVFVMYFNFSSSPRPPGFSQFMKSAYGHLQNDPFQETSFGLVTNASFASELRIVSSPRLFLWNTSMKFPHKKIKFEVLTPWLKENVRNLVNWISISGSKSTSLSDKIQKQPSLILFTPRNHLLNYSPYFSLLKYLITRFMTCDVNPDRLNILNRMRQSLTTDYYKFTNRMHWCLGVDFRETILNCYSYFEKEKSSKCSICLPCKSGPNFTQCVRDGLNAVSHIKTASCSNSYNNHLSRLKIVCGAQDRLYDDESYILDDKIKHLLSIQQEMNCKALKFYSLLNSVPPFYNAKFSQYSYEEGISSQGCNINKSFNVIALDSSMYSDFSLRLGLNISRLKDQTALVLLSAKDEVQYILKDVNMKRLVQFIKDFMNNTLVRHQRSFHKSACDKINQSIVCIDEVTTDNFSEVVLNDSKDVVLMHYTNWCGFCAGIAHIYLSAASYFSSNQNIVFARVNGDYNDLPWHLTASKYPSIFIFPAHRKANSIEFPNSLQITEANLIQFVLYHAQKTVQENILTEKCSKKCLQNNLEMALKKNIALSTEIKSIKQKIHRFRLHDTSNQAYQIKYLNDILKQKSADFEVTKHLIEVLPKILRGEHDQVDILRNPVL